MQSKYFITFLLAYIFLTGFSSSDELARITTADNAFISGLNLPNLADLQELLPKAGDLTCLDQYTETGGKMILVDGEIYPSRPDEDLDTTHFARYYIGDELPGYIRMFESYSHAGLTLSAYKILTGDLLAPGSSSTGDEKFLISVRCVYDAGNGNMTVTKSMAYKQISRCFKTSYNKISGDDGGSDVSGTGLASIIFWCR